jgi:hypothetical protein
MNPSPRLPHLRYAIGEAFAQQQRNTDTVTPGLHHLLPVPIRERLILLARIDGATPHQIRRAVHCSTEDAKCVSDPMVDAIAIWRSTLQDAYWNVPTRPHWRHQKKAPVEKSIKQFLWSDVPVALIGDAALPELVSSLTLKHRLILYGLLVEELPWRRIRPLLRCTDWQIRESIRIGIEAVEGGRPRHSRRHDHLTSERSSADA